MEKLKKCKMEILQQEKLHKYDRIDYNRFLKIYENSQEILKNNNINLDEKEFAQEILEITLLSYKSMKSKRSKPQILKDYEITDEDIQQLRQRLIRKEKLHRNMKVTYNQIKNFFEDKNYYLPLKEDEYYEKLLDIKKSKLKNIILKPSKAHTIILENEEVSEEDILLFRRYVIKKEKLHPSDSLTYTQCMKIFDKYYIALSEEEFMKKILDVSFRSYEASKYNNAKTVLILRNESAPTQKDIQDLKRLIILTEKLHIRDSISYEKFDYIFKKYHIPLSIFEFAEKILDISSSSLMTIKNTKSNAVILKNLNIKDEDILEFRNKVIKKENLHINEAINYERFKKIYNENFFPLSEKEFAQKILDISHHNYDKIKYNLKNKTSILKNHIIPTEEITYIQKKIMEIYKIGEWIDINKFNKIYIFFPSGLLKKDYANQILNISNTKFKNMEKGFRSQILVGQDSYIAKIFKNLKDNGYYLGYKIDLQEFKALYASIGSEGTIQTFANVLGISYGMFSRGIKQPILNQRIKKAKNNFKESIKDKPVEFHTIEEIQSFCKENNLSLDDFIKYILNIPVSEYKESKQLVQKNNGFWYGRKKITCSKKFMEKYTNKIYSIAELIAKSLCVKYKLNNLVEEYISEAVVYIIEKCGDLEKNYKDTEELMFEAIRRRTKLAIKGKIIFDNFIQTKRFIKPTNNKFETHSFKLNGKKYYSNDGENFEIPDNTANTEEQVIKNYDGEYVGTGKIIKTILAEIENGYDVDEVLEVYSKQLKCNKNELVQLIKEFYTNKRKILER